MAEKTVYVPFKKFSEVYTKGREAMTEKLPSTQENLISFIGSLANSIEQVPKKDRDRWEGTGGIEVRRYRGQWEVRQNVSETDYLACGNLTKIELQDEKLRSLAQKLLKTRNLDVDVTRVVAVVSYRPRIFAEFKGTDFILTQLTDEQLEALKKP